MITENSFNSEFYSSFEFILDRNVPCFFVNDGSNDVRAAANGAIFDILLAHAVRFVNERFVRLSANGTKI